MPTKCKESDILDSTGHLIMGKCAFSGTLKKLWKFS